MIEILQRGQRPEERVVRGSCSVCHSDLRWSAGDGKHSECQRDGEWNTVTCPVCHHDVIGHYVTRGQGPG